MCELHSSFVVAQLPGQASVAIIVLGAVGNVPDSQRRSRRPQPRRSAHSRIATQGNSRAGIPMISHPLLSPSICFPPPLPLSLRLMGQASAECEQVKQAYSDLTHKHEAIKARSTVCLFSPFFLFSRLNIIHHF